MQRKYCKIFRSALNGLRYFLANFFKQVYNKTLYIIISKSTPPIRKDLFCRNGMHLFRESVWEGLILKPISEDLFNRV